LARAFKGALSYYGSLPTVLRKTIRVVRSEGLLGLAQRVRVLAHTTGHIRGAKTVAQEETGSLYKQFTNFPVGFQPKVTVIVPNYNHSAYLARRLDSIYGQTYGNFEVILMDDCSSDGSADILRHYQALHAHNTRLVINELNSGGVFNQWKKGLSLATGELIWIAESDDFCELSFLERLVGFFQNPAVMAAFCRTDFVDGSTGETTWSFEEFASDIDVNLWRKPFVRSANWMVNHGWGTKNILPNASAALMRHPGNMPLLQDENWASLRLCGDWVFYLHLIRGGLVGFTPATTNYYRQHAKGTSVQTQKKMVYYQEYEVVARTLLELYCLEENVLPRQRETLYVHWCRWRGTDSAAEFESLYSIKRARSNAKPRELNIMIAGYALIAGGGETFPIVLANQLKRRGRSVTFLNCNAVPTMQGVRSMLLPNLPLLELDGLNRIAAVCADMAVDIIHSHHAWVDVVLANCLNGADRPREVITMHGMYELMDAQHLQEVCEVLDRRVSAIVYTTEKNVAPFDEDFRRRKRAVRIDNALESQVINPVDRSSLGIKEEDFVFCLVARAVAEKGWEEAVYAVRSARKKSERTIHLILIGTGPEYVRLSAVEGDELTHFLGFRANIRDYFAMSDMGLLPSRFAGESFPLVLIDCLLAGRPMLASNLGEIKFMLTVNGSVAGEVFDLLDGEIRVEDLADRMVRLANDGVALKNIRGVVELAASKFDVEAMASKYEAVYRSALH
jgi:glycosyltransferase involved in cell wall biosynthesis